MCTTIALTSPVSGAGKGAAGWFPVTEVTVAYDHPARAEAEHALLIDFSNYGLGTGSRVAVELDLASGRELLARLAEAIEAAEKTGL
ncbi:MAG TPA: DUF6295 family protein [Acidimicrobiales bacterium]|nr:DUF6295 family protein [Acidimicrobiales bacterium]